MTLLLFDLAGVCAAGCVVLAVLWLSGAPVPEVPRRDAPRLARRLTPLALAGVVTGWTVGATTHLVSAGAIAGLFVARLDSFWAASRVWAAHVRRAEALATWADALARLTDGGSGLRTALQASAPEVPAPLTTHAIALADDFESDLDGALRRFQDAVGDEDADFFVAAMDLVAHGQAGDVATSFRRLASDIRDGAESAQRADAAREEPRSSARAVAAIAAVAVVGFAWVHRDFLGALHGTFGEVSVAVCGGLVVLGQRLLATMDAPPTPLRHRLVAQPVAEEVGR